MQPKSLQLELCFPSMDNPSKGTLRIGDIARILNCSEDHVRNLLLDGTIRGGDISRDGCRQHMRVPREEWQRYLITVFGQYDRRRYINPLDSDTIRDIINDCYSVLRLRGEAH